jgi:tRNA-splicing ligase RtcB (3'-phosphate/5'-hydroxy nucleic acid ligase)
VAGTGNMWASAPPFGVPEEEGRWPWEEAGLLERLATLDPPEG